MELRDIVRYEFIVKIKTKLLIYLNDSLYIDGRFSEELHWICFLA